MKYFNHFLGILCAFCLMILFLITSVEAVVYWIPGYFEAKYTKYGVAGTVDMTMEDLLDVTDEMMDYLRGNREDLHVPTVVGGAEREFFNEREIAHMEDVRGLFLAAIALRRICAAVCVLCVLILIWRKASRRPPPQNALYRRPALPGPGRAADRHHIHRFHKIFCHFPQNILQQRSVDP